MKPGDIVLVKFPFANLEDSKKRPALVLVVTPISKKAEIVTIAMITSRIDGLKIQGDVTLTDWEKAKLIHPSLVRLSKLATLDQELIEKKIGQLSATDHSAVSKTVQKQLQHWL